MALWRTYYHIIWATKERQSLIVPQLEKSVYQYMVGKSDSMRCIVHAIGGTENHIHLIVSIPPTLSIADFVQKIKGSSSHYINQELTPHQNFKWQRGYGIFSLGGKQLEKAVNYVLNQKQHHSDGTILPALEEDTNEDDPPPKYQVNH